MHLSSHAGRLLLSLRWVPASTTKGATPSKLRKLKPYCQTTQRIVTFMPHWKLQDIKAIRNDRWRKFPEICVSLETGLKLSKLHVVIEAFAFSVDAFNQNKFGSITFIRCTSVFVLSIVFSSQVKNMHAVISILWASGFDLLVLQFNFYASTRIAMRVSGTECRDIVFTLDILFLRSCLNGAQDKVRRSKELKYIMSTSISCSIHQSMTQPCDIVLPIVLIYKWWVHQKQCSPIRRELVP